MNRLEFFAMGIKGALVAAVAPVARFLPEKKKSVHDLLPDAKMNFAVDVHAKKDSLTITVPKQGEDDWIRFVTRQSGENMSVKIENNQITEIRDEVGLYVPHTGMNRKNM